MSGIQDIPHIIPEKWNATWFRRFIAESLSKLDTRNAVGVGVVIDSDGNSVATLDISDTVSSAVSTHNAEPTAHATQISSAISTHAAAPNPHPVYATDTDLSTHASTVSGVHGISAYGATLVDDTTASAARTTLDVPQRSATTVANVTGGSTVDTECRAQLNALLAVLRSTGVIGT